MSYIFLLLITIFSGKFRLLHFFTNVSPTIHIHIKKKIYIYIHLLHITFSEKFHVMSIQCGNHFDSLNETCWFMLYLRVVYPVITKSSSNRFLLRNADKKKEFLVRMRVVFCFVSTFWLFDITRLSKLSGNQKKNRAVSDVKNKTPIIFLFLQI